MDKANFQYLTFFHCDKKLLNLDHCAVLKLRESSLNKEIILSLEFFIRRLKKHAPFAGFEPGPAYPEGKGNKADNPVVNLPVILSISAI
jgi:hypothetical protein